MDVRNLSRTSPLGGVFSLISQALAGFSFAPAQAASAAPPVAAPRTSVWQGLWDRLDRWAWRQVQREQEAYLSRAQNLFDLEQRMRNLDSYRGRFY